MRYIAERAGPVVHGTMRGGGYDSAVIQGATDAIDGAIRLVHAAIRRLPDPDTSLDPENIYACNGNRA